MVANVGPIAVVVSRFPAVTETFILRELTELERQGIEVVLVPLLRHEASSVHPEVEPWLERALYSPFVNPKMLLTNVSVFLRRPLLYLSTLFTLLWEARGSANAFFGTLGIFLKSVWNGERVRHRGVTHIHAHFATHPASAAYIMSRVHASDTDLPYSVSVHAHDIFIHQAGLHRKLCAAAFVRSISRFNVDFLLERFAESTPRLGRDHFRVIHCGLEPDRYRHVSEPGRPAIGRPARVLCVASLRLYKGVTHLIEAFARLDAAGIDAHLEVIGEGELRGSLESQIAQEALADRIWLVGTRTQSQVVDALARADVFVLPSVVAPDGQMEGIPVSLMEAMAAGVPVVATRLSGIPELVVDGETGVLVEPADAAALAGAIRRTLDDPESAQGRAERGRALVRRQFEIGPNVGRLVEALIPYATVAEPQGDTDGLSADSV